MLLARGLRIAKCVVLFGRVTVVGLAVGWLVSCGGADGDPCQQVSDCDDGLVCCDPGGAPVSGGERGTCRVSCELVRTDASVDGGPDLDASSVDAAADGQAEAGSDAGATDGSADGAADGSADGAVDGGDSSATSDASADASDDAASDAAGAAPGG